MLYNIFPVRWFGRASRLLNLGAAMLHEKIKIRWVLFVLLSVSASITRATIVRLDMAYGSLPVGALYVELFDVDTPKT